MYTAVCDPGPVVVTVMQISMEANWEYMENLLILTKMGLPNHSPSWPTAWSGSVFWVADCGWGEPAVPSFSKADALRCSTGHRQSYVLPVTRSSWSPCSGHICSWFQELWSWLLMDIERAVNWGGTEYKLLLCFLQNLGLQTSANLENSCKAGSPLSTGQDNQPLPPLPFLHWMYFFACLGWYKIMSLILLFRSC